MCQTDFLVLFGLQVIQAALSGNLPMRYEDLAALSPVVRKEVLTGEFSRRVKAMGTVPASDIEGVVDGLVNLSLSDVVEGIQDPSKLAEQVKNLRPNKSPSPAASASASQDSRLLDPNALNATASAPEHPSTPISVSASLSTPPRTSSPSGSVPPTSERDRMLAAISKLESAKQTELTDLLMSLPKRERALCLFNVEVLRAKLADAKVVLESDEADDLLAQSTQSAPPVPSTPQARKPSSSTINDSPQTPDLSSRGPSAAASPTPGTPGSGSSHTIASLARLPASEIIRLANSNATGGLPLPKADPLVVKATDDFMDGLLDLPIEKQKQALGDKLYVAFFFFFFLLFRCLYLVCQVQGCQSVWHDSWSSALAIFVLVFGPC
jgi:polyadenylate-binding protein